MNLTKLFDKLAGRHQQLQRARKADFRTLVQQAADGQEPDVAFVDRVLTDNGKTLDELKAAVELLLKRRALRRTYDELPKLTREREQIETRIEEANQALEAAETKHQELTFPLFCRLDQIRQANMDAGAAQRELQKTCMDEGLISDLAAVRQRLSSLNSRRSKCELESKELRSQAKSDREEIGYITNEDKIAMLRQRADERDTQAEGMELELVKLNHEIAEAERQERVLLDQMLDP